MKKTRKHIDLFLEQLDKKWRALPLRKQHHYILCFFTGYLVLTTGVVFKTWYDTSRSKKDMFIDHIKNPVLKKNPSHATLQDTLTIINNQMYEK